MARPQGPEVVEQTAVEVELDHFLRDNVYPALGNLRYSKLLTLIEDANHAHYGRGYLQGGRDERVV